MSTSPADFNAQIIDEFHANDGRVGGMFEGTPLLLLHHTGAHSGKHRVNPVGYLIDGGRYVVIASNGGAPTNPNWYHNLKAHPNGRSRSEPRRSTLLHARRPGTSASASTAPWSSAFRSCPNTRKRPSA